MKIFLMQFVIFLTVIFIGVKKSGSLGVVAMLGLASYIFLFGVSPTEPPLKITILLLSIIMTSSSLGACGGFDYLTYMAQKYLKKYPKMITIIAPIICFFITLFMGTSFAIISILPMIYNISKKSGIRPERPLTASIVASNQGMMCSPLSATNLALIDILSPYNIDIKIVYMILMISTFCGTVCAALSVYNSGENIKKIETLEVDDQMNKSFSFKIKLSVMMFFGMLVLIAFFGILENLRPKILVNGINVPINIFSLTVISLLALSVVIILICNVKIYNIFDQQSFKLGINAVLSVFGIAWFSSTFVSNNEEFIIPMIKSFGGNNVLFFGLLVFIFAAFIGSQSSTILMLFPIGLMLGLNPMYLIIFSIITNAVLILPSYPLIQSATIVDKETIHIGKYIVNHSFVKPALVAIAIGVLISSLLIKFYFF